MDYLHTGKHSRCVAGITLSVLLPGVKTFEDAKPAGSKVQQATPYLHPSMRRVEDLPVMQQLGSPAKVGEVQRAQVVGAVAGHAEPEIAKLRDMLSLSMEWQGPAANLFPGAANRIKAVGADGAWPSGGYADGRAITKQHVGLDGCAVIGWVVDVGRPREPVPLPAILAVDEGFEDESIASCGKPVHNVQGLMGGVRTSDRQGDGAVPLGFVKAGNGLDGAADGVAEDGVARRVH